MIVALARKIPGILWHLLVNRKPYVEPGVRRTRKSPMCAKLPLPSIAIDGTAGMLLECRVSELLA
ncbi:MAG TPA: hypothetical protein PKK74_02095 [Candidatus Methanoculleus thermohydrogenotrophicum]|nr:hypothetical protein [Candidatus Methanoculleus thermohydrogenotrophicum]NLM81980.1 hypothetical protein [Candidatus Methanoculleus thermohydrogenotrophicum]HOB17476.1 hypothetical protein [Candidatus Methanoculleus thermohydrogenotrophicum]HPZ37631.1 hypothetical protein [Candidatus Methanoculleus thermohydrogenotrophicum]